MADKGSIVPKAAPRERTRHGGHPWRYRLGSIFSPQRWSLKGRFVYFTGLLLSLGILAQAYVMSTSLNRTMRQEAMTRLQHLETLLSAEKIDAENLLRSQAVVLAGMERVAEWLANHDVQSLEHFIRPYADSIRGATGVISMHFRFVDASGRSLAWTGPAAMDSEQGREHDYIYRVLEETAVMGGYATGLDGLELRMAAPVVGPDGTLGCVEVSMPVDMILEHMVSPPATNIILLSPKNLVHGFRQEGSWQILGDWAIRAPILDRELPGIAQALESGIAEGRIESEFYRFLSLSGISGMEVGGLLLLVDTSLGSQERKNEVYRLVGFFLVGALVLWGFIWFNAHRVEEFLKQLKKIIVASHGNDFGEGFESDFKHCLEVMRCSNRECPVYINPSLVCYLETGSMAISPKWRDTCIHLNTYEDCRNCPVYNMRNGDQLREMRDVVNTMMRLWSDFLGKAGRLLASVLRSQETTGQLPSLDEVSERLERMAELTSFGRDLQGTMGKDEVYAQLAHMLEHNLGVTRFVLFEVDNDADRLLLVQDRLPNEQLCKREVLVATDLCRASRVAEDVVSFWNPKLCPHFNCDHDQDVRCCLPMVMGGQVGAVLSFLTPRMTWETHVRPLMPIISKYLAEAAPVLSSLKLLNLTKEQALKDALTHCHNRRFLDEFISKYEPLSLRDGRKTGFIMADLDFFKQVNDQLGHEAGDMVLKQVAGVIQRRIRKSDLLVRYGGEEFLVLLQDVQEGMAQTVAEEIRLGVANHVFEVGGEKAIHKTISLGVSEFPGDAKGMWRTVKFADVALYEAKRKGRNQVVRFTDDMWSDEEF